MTEAARACAEEQSLVAKAQAEHLRMEQEEEDALVRRQRALMRYESHMVGCSPPQPRACGTGNSKMLAPLSPERTATMKTVKATLFGPDVHQGRRG